MFNLNQNPNRQKTMTFEFADQSQQIAKIRVVGVGGAGGNAVNRMISEGLTGVDFIAMNTDHQALEQNRATCRIQIGKNLTKGLGAGGNPDIGRKAIEETKDAVVEVLSSTDMVFIACGMGGGTGTGAAPVVAEIARDLGALTVGIVTKPFQFEGNKRLDKADQGIKALKDHVDTLIVVPNQKLIGMVPKKMPLNQAFRMADEILMHATKGISDVINVPGLVNLDFADVKTVMSNMGDALMGSGVATGDTRAQEAANMAITSPLIEDVNIAGAQGVLVNITGGEDLALSDVDEATSIITEAAGHDANIIFGAVIDPEMKDAIRVTVIATGFYGRRGGNGYHKENRQNLEEMAGQLSKSDIPIFQKMDGDPLYNTMSEIFGHDGGLNFISKDDLNVPAFIRRQQED